MKLIRDADFSVEARQAGFPPQNTAPITAAEQAWLDVLPDQPGYDSAGLAHLYLPALRLTDLVDLPQEPTTALVEANDFDHWLRNVTQAALDLLHEHAVAWDRTVTLVSKALPRPHRLPIPVWQVLHAAGQWLAMLPQPRQNTSDGDDANPGRPVADPSTGPGAGMTGYAAVRDRWLAIAEPLLADHGSDWFTAVPTRFARTAFADHEWTDPGQGHLADLTDRVTAATIEAHDRWWKVLPPGEHGPLYLDLGFAGVTAAEAARALAQTVQAADPDAARAVVLERLKAVAVLAGDRRG